MFAAFQNTHRRTRCMTVIVILLATAAEGDTTGRGLLDALLAGDSKLNKRLLTAGVPVNSTDESGASALVYAALYSEYTQCCEGLNEGFDF